MAALIDAHAEEMFEVFRAELALMAGAGLESAARAVEVVTHTAVVGRAEHLDEPAFANEVAALCVRYPRRDPEPPSGARRGNTRAG